MIAFTAFLAVAAAVCFVLRSKAIFEILFVTFLTSFYHFAIRLAVGETVTLLCKNRTFSYDSFWFREHHFEPKLYALLRVKRWKTKLITARPEQFDVSKRTSAELLFYMAQAEIVHEIGMALSFVPLLLIFPYGKPAVFLLTSLAACLIDAVFVIIQRYNRPRLRRILQKRRNHDETSQDHRHADGEI